MTSDNRCRPSVLSRERWRLAQVQDQVERAFDLCHEVVLRGGVPDGLPAAGAFLTPSLIAHGYTSAFFCQEEIFGPFLELERFEDKAEAVAKANHTVFGLWASVWTTDGARCASPAPCATAPSGSTAQPPLRRG
ncbi:acyl-CoA reductase-like NAD-dependent aldehyde dehydrogenase [Azospirillum lipoferum]|uniref:aldehyde dehydrogenase family protein n=1 Tax=Azospirillum TaxID=191 RepID=UPI001B3BE99F|nr:MULTISPECIES: aldehyde dehydrogenase family protein [Azospirillum]MCP1612684.1 acyl-CoA reductase-like NAD-dependent aldehyde dehydrogenase [Azospirillum lipoferum]MDW5532176.1 aldehyde dehydrogenase family protein [Azospirillum sp. NL1]